MPVKNQEPNQETNETESDKQAQTVSTGRSAAPQETSKSEAPKRKVEEDKVPQSYVWLANGEVLRANDEDLPGSAGHMNPHGYWQKDGSVYLIVAVYPCEDKAEE